MLNIINVFYASIKMITLNGHEFKQTSGDSEGQRSLACCSVWGHRKSDTT